MEKTNYSRETEKNRSLSQRKTTVETPIAGVSFLKKTFPKFRKFSGKNTAFPTALKGGSRFLMKMSSPGILLGSGIFCKHFLHQTDKVMLKRKRKANTGYF